MVKISVSYEGGLHCRAAHGPSGCSLSTDAPVDNQGRGESFSPTDLVATALGTCMLTIMGIVAEKHGLDLSGTVAEVEKQMSSDAPRRIARLVSTVTLPGGFTAEQKRMLEQAALACPVHQSVHPDIDRPVEFLWGD